MGAEGKQEDCESSRAFKQGCLETAETAARKHAGIIGTAGVIVACLMLLGMIFSCILFKMI